MSAKRSHRGGGFTKSPRVTTVELPFSMKELHNPSCAQNTNKEHNKNLNALNQLMGSTKRLLGEIYLEALSPSKERERLGRLERDLLDTLRNFLAQARVLHLSL